MPSLLHSLFQVLATGFLVYFLCLNLGYLALNLLGAWSLNGYLGRLRMRRVPADYGRFEPPVSVLIPAFNEALTIVSSVQSALQLEYQHLQVIVINDGSTDATLSLLAEHFGLRLSPLPGEQALPTQAIRGFWRTPREPRLLVIDKVNGGKADSLNAGISFAEHPLVCCLDADSILERASLRQGVSPFLDSRSLAGCGGIVRVANGCRIEAGFMAEPGLSDSWLARFQTIEYLRAFLFGRQGWQPLNALLIVSGAFGIFERRTLIDIGGYDGETVGEDMELTLRLHRELRAARRPYRIGFVAYPVCWTQVPEDFKTLRHQRIRWQRGLLESLSRHIGLLFDPRGGTVSWLAFPFFLLFEALGPLIELSAWALMLLGALLGYLPPGTLGLFLLATVGLGSLLSLSALLLEELSFRVYPRYRQIFALVLAAICEHLGYRQLTLWWRLQGSWQWLRGARGDWGRMRRQGIDTREA